MFAETLSWEAEPAPIILGQKNPIDFQAEVATSPYGKDSLSGSDLWKLGLFGSKKGDGSGVRLGELQQLLSSEQVALEYNAGETLRYDNMRQKFDLGLLGCKAYRYLCLEFGQAKRPDPEFNFYTGPGTPTLITCEEQPCRSGKKRVDSLFYCYPHILFLYFQSFSGIFTQIMHRLCHVLIYFEAL